MLWPLTRCFGVAWPRCMQPCFYFFNLEDIFGAFSRIRYTLTWYRRLFYEIFLFVLWYAVSMVLHCLRLLSIPPKSPFSSFIINLSFYARETCMAGFGKSFLTNLTRPSLWLNLLFSAFQLCWCMNSYILTVSPHHAHSRHSHEIQGC